MRQTADGWRGFPDVRRPRRLKFKQPSIGLRTRHDRPEFGQGLFDRLQRIGFGQRMAIDPPLFEGRGDKVNGPAMDVTGGLVGRIVVPAAVCGRDQTGRRQLADDLLRQARW
ncbi:MAG: hypothetical protein WAL90_18230 [Desulfobacterales bacterium]